MSESKPSIVVVGVTGSIGQATVRSLSAKYSDRFSIVACSRSPDSDKVQALAGLDGVSLRAATLGDAESVAAVSAGAHSVFIVTPPTEDRAELAAVSAQAAATAGAGGVVVVSVAAAGDESVLFGRQFKDLEERVASVNATLLRLPMFVDNLWGHAGSIKSDGKFYAPADGAAKTSQVVVSDVGDAAAAVLADPAPHAGRTYTLISDTFSHDQVAAAFTEALGKPVELVRVPGEAAQAAMEGFGMPGWQAAGVVELFDMINDGKGAVESSDLETLLGRAPTSVAEWVSANAAGFSA